MCGTAASGPQKSKYKKPRSGSYSNILNNCRSAASSYHYNISQARSILVVIIVLKAFLVLILIVGLVIKKVFLVVLESYV